MQELNNTLTLDKFSLTLNALGLNGLVSYRSLFLNTRLISLTLNGLTLRCLDVLKGLRFGAYGLGFGLRLVVRWVGGGVCVINSLCVRTVSAVVHQVKVWCVGVVSPAVGVVLCQYRVTRPAVVAVPCFASGILSVAIDTPRPHDLHALTSPDPHPHNFGARYDIHPTLTPTTFSPFKNTCPQGQYINNAMEAQHETR